MKTTTETKKPCGHGCKRGECVVCTNVNNPEHYGGKDNPYEAIKVIEAWGLGFNLGNAIKYIARNGKKDNALQDLEKCKWYIEREISKLKGQNPIDEFLGEIGQISSMQELKQPMLLYLLTPKHLNVQYYSIARSPSEACHNLDLVWKYLYDEPYGPKIDNIEQVGSLINQWVICKNQKTQ